MKVIQSVGIALFCLVSNILVLVHAGISHNEVNMDLMMMGGDASPTQNASEIIPKPYPNTHTHGLPILQHHDLTASQKMYWESYNTTTYFTTSLGNRPAFKYHVFTVVVVVLFVYPVCLMLNNVDSNWYLPLLTVNLVLVLTSLFSLSIFASTFPDDKLYPNNIYGYSSWFLLFIIVLHYLAAVVSKAANWISDDKELMANKNTVLERNSTCIPMNDYNSTNLENIDYESSNFLSDSPNTDAHIDSPAISTDAQPNRTLLISTNDSLYIKDSFELDDDIETQRNKFTISEPTCVESLRLKLFMESNQRHNKPLQRVFYQSILQQLASRFGVIFIIIFNCLNYFLFPFLMANACFGLAVGNLLGKKERIFNLLAHWIKGGVFVLLGIVSLARYCGFGSKYGWAWNRIVINKDQRGRHSIFSFITMPRGTITMEGLESILIFFYGSTNVFLEHLAAAGGAWTAKDLQHVSIAFMYIGAGLCGLLTEIKLNEWKFKQVVERSENHIPEEEVSSCSPGYSPNPFPTFTIFWTGILMSQHTQASEVSTKVHVQWGSLLSYGSFFRLLTFIVLFLVPSTNSVPAKPFTELITSFCMLCGGLIFMESTDQVIEAMEYSGYTPMFTLNLSIGIISLVMAWEMILFLWRDYLKTLNIMEQENSSKCTLE